MIVTNESDTWEQSRTFRNLLNGCFLRMSPQERDRNLQFHFAQARGPAKNLRLLCETTAMLFRARRMMRKVERPSGEERDL